MIFFHFSNFLRAWIPAKGIEKVQDQQTQKSSKALNVSVKASSADTTNTKQARELANDQSQNMAV